MRLIEHYIGSRYIKLIQYPPLIEPGYDKLWKLIDLHIFNFKDLKNLNSSNNGARHMFSL
jgi:hypothetical protein